MDRTLLIVKPDATERNLIGHIVSRLEKARFKIVEMRMVRLTEEKARAFYAVHEGKPFLKCRIETAKEAVLKESEERNKS